MLPLGEFPSPPQLLFSRVLCSHLWGAIALLSFTVATSEPINSPTLPLGLFCSLFGNPSNMHVPPPSMGGGKSHVAAFGIPKLTKTLRSHVDISKGHAPTIGQL